MLDEARNSRGISHCNLIDFAYQQGNIDAILANVPQTLTAQASYGIRRDFASGLEAFAMLTRQRSPLLGHDDDDDDDIAVL